VIHLNAECQAGAVPPGVLALGREAVLTDNRPERDEEPSRHHVKSTVTALISILFEDLHSESPTQVPRTWLMYG
jgi:hypothetical protein